MARLKASPDTSLQFFRKSEVRVYCARTARLTPGPFKNLGAIVLTLIGTTEFVLSR